MNYLGIDPGFEGAIAFYAPSTGTLNVLDMPVVTDPKGRTILDMGGLFEALRPHQSPKNRITVILERVGPMPKQGIASAFRFGEGYGALQMAIAAHRFPIIYTTPAVWKKHFGLVKDKGASRGLAQQRFPYNAMAFARVKDDGRAEAALIALYGAEKKLGATP